MAETTHAGGRGESFCDTRNVEGASIPKRTTTWQIAQEAIDERMRQDNKWGPQNRSMIEWMSILVEEIGEAAMATNHFTFFGIMQHSKEAKAMIRKELIQSAAVCIAMIEQIDNGEARVIA